MTARISAPESGRLRRGKLRLCLLKNCVPELFEVGRVPGTVCQCQGQEAVAAGARACLTPQDLLTSTRRFHGPALVRPCSPPLKEAFVPSAAKIISAVQPTLAGKGKA
jgi:TPP-dependent pyruvate/acetoin dehydrogenase alpha subunit